MAMHRLILASGSKARREMLAAAGLVFEVMPVALDEENIMAGLAQDHQPAEIAAALAQQKALSIAHNNPDAYVIGGDQILVCEGRLYSKAADKQKALQKLQSLSGKTHSLISAVCVVRGDNVLWAYRDSARLAMRIMNEEDIQDYLECAGDAVTGAVGAYELEGPGAWLFDKVEGDYYTILGMPLLPLLGFLRQHGFKPVRRAV